MIRRCPAIIKEPTDGPVLKHTYTRAIARPHGWVFVIPLTAHTSYGYIFNRDVSDLEEVEKDFDELLAQDGVAEFENAPCCVFRILSTAGSTTAPWPASATRAVSWNRWKQPRSGWPRCRSG